MNFLLSEKFSNFYVKYIRVAMSNRKFGLAAFDSSISEIKQLEDVKSDILNKQNKELEIQLEIFQEKLIEFAKKHNKEIKENSDIRIKFLKMCSSIGIDSMRLFDKKDNNLIDIEDFYYELSVKIIEICRGSKDINGGIISFLELENVYFREYNISYKDIEKAINMIRDLDGGFEIIKIGKKKFLRSIPNELTEDQTKILQVCSVLGYSTMSILKANLNWRSIRSKAVLDEMVSSGLLWVDDQAGDELFYWDPSFITRGS